MNNHPASFAMGFLLAVIAFNVSFSVEESICQTDYNVADCRYTYIPSGSNLTLTAPNEITYDWPIGSWYGREELK